MKKENRQALSFLLLAVGICGRAFLGVPTEVTIADVSLTVLCLAGAALLGKHQAIIPATGQLLLELVLCGMPGRQGLWLWLWPVLRLADLALLVWMLTLALQRACTLTEEKDYHRHSRWQIIAQLVLGALLAVATLASTALPEVHEAQLAASGLFLAFSLAMLWGVLLLIRAYRKALPQKK